MRPFPSSSGICLSAMTFLFSKNLATFYVIISLLLVSIISNSFINAPVCKVITDDRKFYSCGKVTSDPNDDITSTDIPLLYVAYAIMLCKALVFLFLCFINNDLRNPFSSRSEKDQNKKPNSVKDLRDEVVGILQTKLDIEYILVEIGIHMADVLHTLVHCVIIYLFSAIWAMSMGYSWEEAKYKLIPSVKRCRFSHWPYLVECKIHVGSVFQIIFIVLWSWYVFTALIVISEIASKIRSYIQRRQKLKDTYYTRMEAWLFDVCEEHVPDLNWMARCLRIRNFESAARLVVLDARVKRYAAEKFGYNSRAQGSIPDNGELVKAHPWWL